MNVFLVTTVFLCIVRPLHLQCRPRLPGGGQLLDHHGQRTSQGRRDCPQGRIHLTHYYALKVASVVLELRRCLETSSIWNQEHLGHSLAAAAELSPLQVQAAGDSIGDMFEISTVRREDWDFIQVLHTVLHTAHCTLHISLDSVTTCLQDKSGEFVSVLQCNNAPSSRTPRGHQFPAAFMMQVS